MLRDDDLGAASVEIGDDGVAVESLAGDQPPKTTPSSSGSTPAMSGSSGQASNGFKKTSALRPSLKRRNAVLQFPQCAGRSRRRLPVRANPQNSLDETAIAAPAAAGVRRLA